MNSIRDRFFVLGLALLTIAACEDRKELLDADIYDGPIMEMVSVNTIMSDSGKLVMRLIAPVQRQFENGDREWPDGLELIYYQNERVISTYRSNATFFVAEENIYRGEGNVIVKNQDTGDEMTTEILYWSPGEERFYTDNFVTIISDGEIHTGQGLSANQDFSSYQILKPSGTIQVQEEF